ncbi:hypothetical protein OROGR_028318 [Orobanche gracilis]
MSGRTGRRSQHDETGEIKKGPWKAEEDEVLRNHVRKYGPRDWSSIRSNGLLRRTGKSCRLRWVNKLRPDLKTGMKFSAEEERTVIDLQAQYGNKWATISTFLPGRTDNDVKNFWSSRQKRLARMLQLQPISNFTEEAPKMSSSMEEASLAKLQSCSSSSHIIDHLGTVKMVPFTYPSYEPDTLRLEYTPPNQNPMTIIPEQQEESRDLSFPPMDSQQDIMIGLEDPNFLGEFEKSALGVPQLDSVFDPDGISDRTVGSRDAAAIDSLTDYLPPIDIFDHIPIPPEWP